MLFSNAANLKLPVSFKIIINIRGHSQRTSALEGEGGVWPMRTLVDVGRWGVFAAADVLF